MRRQAITLSLLALLSLAAAAGCGVGAVEGHYSGSVSGSWTLLGIPFPINGDLSFELTPAGGDIYSAAGDLRVLRSSDKSVIYDATLSGQYAAGHLDLTFSSKDGKSSGTMTASTLAGQCFNNGTWTVSYVGGSGSGSWSACR